MMQRSHIRSRDCNINDQVAGNEKRLLGNPRGKEVSLASILTGSWCKGLGGGRLVLIAFERSFDGISLLYLARRRFPLTHRLRASDIILHGLPGGLIT